MDCSLVKSEADVRQLFHLLTPGSLIQLSPIFPALSNVVDQLPVQKLFALRLSAANGCINARKCKTVYWHSINFASVASLFEAGRFKCRSLFLDLPDSLLAQVPACAVFGYKVLSVRRASALWLPYLNKQVQSYDFSCPIAESSVTLQAVFDRIDVCRGMNLGVDSFADSDRWAKVIRDWVLLNPKRRNVDLEIHLNRTDLLESMQKNFEYLADSAFPRTVNIFSKVHGKRGKVEEFLQGGLVQSLTIQTDFIEVTLFHQHGRSIRIHLEKRNKRKLLED